ncbi:hypothetical protein RB601_003907 [Gaeumannomyces tritici]
MDPPSTLASPLAGLQTAKFLHTTLSAVKDAPEAVVRAAEYTLQVQAVLEHCHKSRAVERDPAIELYVRKCVDSCKLLDEKLLKLNEQPADNTGFKTWRYLRSILGEKDIQKFCAEAGRELGALQMRLHTSSSNVIWDTRDVVVDSRTGLETLTRTLRTTADAHSTSIRDIERSLLASIASKSASIETTLRTATDAHSASIHNVETNVLVHQAPMLTSIEAQVQSASASTADAVRQLLATTTSHHQTSIQALEEKSNMSQSKLDQIFDLLKRVKEEPASTNGARMKDESALSEMVESMRSLGELVGQGKKSIKTSRPHDYFDNDLDDDKTAKDKLTNDKLADDIIRHLRTIVDALEKEGRANSAQPLFSKGRQPLDEARRHGEALAMARRDLNLNFGLSRLYVNGSDPVPWSPLSLVQGHTGTLILIETPLGAFRIERQTRRGREARRAGPNDQQRLGLRTAEGREGFVDCITKLTFLPHNSSEFKILVASTLQRHMPGGAILSISRLEVNRVLPASSEVFRVVKEGRLEDFKTMLYTGSASIRDHDEYGASLLFSTP